jgi:WD40 repeat protein
MVHKRKTRLLLIGIDKYLHWQILSNPVSDCQGFFRVLTEHYGFSEQDLIHENRQPLYDEQATTDNIYDELYRLSDKDEFGRPRIGPEENLIIYFAGHGHLDRNINQGHWISVETPLPRNIKPSEFEKKTISVSKVVQILSNVQAHHVVLIVDACFPQAFARKVVEVPHSTDPSPVEEKPSRWVLTSGRLEPVMDKSPFAEALRNLLERNDQSRLSIVKLGAEVMEQVGKTGLQNAWSSSLTENSHDGGEFFFYRQSPLPIAAPLAPQGISMADLPARMRQGSQAYLERLKNGRFKYLRIEKLLLTETNLPDLIDHQVKMQEQKTPLYQTVQYLWNPFRLKSNHRSRETPLYRAVQSLWSSKRSHAVVLGEGGMGKTVSLLRLWEDWLASPAAAVPVFVALNEYNAVPETEKHDFILRSIARNCGLAESLTGEWKNALWTMLRQRLPDDRPAILLLLDGFNEVTAERSPLLIELNRLAQEAKSVQMVITSRYVEIRNFSWARQSEILELIPLPLERVSDYLKMANLYLPPGDALCSLLGNPMMLTLFAGSSQIAYRSANDDRFRFLPAQSVGELLWNFTEAQLAKYFEDSEHEHDEQIWHRFLMRCLLPYVAFRMEEEGQFFLAYRRRRNPDFNFQSLLDEAFVSLNRTELIEVFPEFEDKRRLLGLGEPIGLDARENRSRRVREYLVEKFHLLVFEKEELRFLHQNFRDFFAACHLLNEAAFSAISVASLPIAWTSRTLPVFLRRMLGQIEGECYFDPKKYATGQPMPGFQVNNRLNTLLDRCRDVFQEKPVRYAVWNLVKTIADARGTLAGMNLERLDLWMIYFNAIPLSQYLGSHQYLPARLQNSLLRGKQLFAQGHSEEVTSVCYSPDGKKILSGSVDRTLKEWSVESGECLQTFAGHSHWVKSVCYSPDGEKVLSGAIDETIKEWSVISGECLQTLVGHSKNVTSVCYSPDGEKILSGAEDKTVKEWSVFSGECLQTFAEHSEEVTSVCYSPDGKKILSGSKDGTLKEWSVENGLCLQTFAGHSGEVASICYSPDGKKVLSGSSDGTLKEWIIANGLCMQTITGDLGQIRSVCYSPDGEKILSGAIDGTVKEWLIVSGECTQTFVGHSAWINSVCYSPDGKKVLSGSNDYTLKEWTVATGECLQTFAGYSERVRSVCYSPDGTKMLSGSYDKTMKEWAVASKECLQIFAGHSSGIESVCYSPDGGKVLSGAGDTLKEWSVASGECLQTITGHLGSITSICYSPDGRKILSGSGGGTLAEWWVASGECLKTFAGHTEGINTVSYSPDGKKVLSGSYDKTVKEWLAASGKCLQTFVGHSNGIDSACYSPDGKKMLSGSYDTVKEWSVANGKCLQTFNGESIVGESICYSPDGKKVLSEWGFFNSTLKEWSVESGECLHTFSGHEHGITSVCYSPDGKKVLSGAEDGTLKEWSVESGECLHTLFNVAGLMVWGCDFNTLVEGSIITKEEGLLLRMYGAVLDKDVL